MTYEKLKGRARPHSESVKGAQEGQRKELTVQEQERAKANWLKLRQVMPELCEFFVEMSKNKHFDGRRALANTVITERGESNNHAG